LTEATYQRNLIKRIKELLPGAVVMKNDPGYIQGIPDLIVLWQNKWAALEVKVSGSSNIQPNQQYYVDQLGAMSYAAFIHPDNESEVLYELQRAFGVGG
jgi:hypothetical protein